MIPEFGHFSLIIALGLSLALAFLPALGVYRRDALLMQTGPSIATGLFVLLAFSFSCLVYSFIQDDFSVAYVANNSNTALHCSTRSLLYGVLTKVRFYYGL